MTNDLLKAWLDARRPERPAELVARMDAAIREYPDAASSDRRLSEVLAQLGLLLLRKVSGPSQADALDLLAADAFVTYAIEAAGEEGSDVGTLVNRLLREAA